MVVFENTLNNYVSSTFHLIRLAREIDLNASAFEQTHKNINNIFLIGSESESDVKKDLKTGAYLRFMFFDIYHYILHNTRMVNKAMEPTVATVKGDGTVHV